jgi:hypothetical protein
MTWSVDARVPVVLASLSEIGEGDAALIESAEAPERGARESFLPVAGAHVAGCACCVARGPAAVALDRLFQRRARGEVGFFRRVVVVTATAEGDMEVWSALRNDPVASARFRLVEV